MKTIRRILYATDFSRASGRAFDAATHLAVGNRATLTILHAYVPIVPLVPEQYIESMTWDRIDTETRRFARGQVDRLVEKARKRGVRARGIVVVGDPVTQILRRARSVRADLIVIGTHGRQGLTKFLLGSVAERVVATAPGPVMTVRGRGER